MFPPRKILLSLSLPLALLIIVSGIYSYSTPNFYEQESANWQAQSLGQDIIDVCLISPLLLLASFYLYKKQFALYAWAGINLYIAYTYTIFCFAVHFNSLFIIYCIILGLSFYSLILFFYFVLKPGAPYLTTRRSKSTGVYFIVVSSLFYATWLMEIIPSLVQDKIPAAIKEAGLLSNPVWILDLAIFLPAIFICGIFLLYRVKAGYIIAPVLLTFMILMNSTIAFLSLYMQGMGLAQKDIFVPIIMAALSVFAFLFWWHFFIVGKKHTPLQLTTAPLRKQ